MKDPSQKAFQTRAVHAGKRVPPGKYTPVTSPMYTDFAYTKAWMVK